MFANCEWPDCLHEWGEVQESGEDNVVLSRTKNIWYIVQAILDFR